MYAGAMLLGPDHPPDQTDVLVVGASGTERGHLATLLESSGYRVRSTEVSFQDFSELRDFPPNLVVLDGGADRAKAFLYVEILREAIPNFHGAVLLVTDSAPTLSKRELADCGVSYLIARPFLAEEFHLLVEAAIRSLNLELAAVNFQRQLEEDLLLATSVQRSLLPVPAPPRPGIVVATAYRPSHRLGGDFFDVIDLREEETGLFLGDVAGHGVAAALFPAVLSAHLSQAVVRAQRRNPEETLTSLNETLVPIFGNLGRFVTAVYLTFSPRRKALLYSVAGHPLPFLVRTDGSCERLELGGCPLGIEAGATFPQASIPFGVGDRLFVFSDGCFEQAWHGKGLGFGLEQLERALAETRGPSLQADLEQMLEMIEEWAGIEGLSDDVSLLAIERSP